ncbi:MAG: tRNA pseudouridine(38-40) synthase TruA [Alphaproteobacteria bacterium]
MPRFALKIEYDGQPFFGWQRQPTLTTVQGEMEAAVRKLESDCELVQGAGRTDSGVHATGQVAHVDLKRDWTDFRLNEALNFHLKPAPISILQIARVADDFHARFSAVERRYQFRILSRRAPLTFDRGTIWQVPTELDAEAMQKAADYLIGKHDFTTFRSTICQAASPVKTLDELRVEVIDHPHGTEYRFYIRARSFLHNQVRSFIGTLERVGAGAWEPEQVKHALEAADRAECGPVSPPHGLYLAKVIYPEDPFTQK